MMSHGQDWSGPVVSGTTAYAGSKQELLKYLETEFLRPEGEPKALHHWFLRDTWTMVEGLMLLMGIDPRTSKLRPSAHLCDSERVPLDEFSVIAFLDGRTVDFQAWQALFENHCASERRRREVRRMMQVMGEQFRESRSLWQSGMHPDRNAPSYYVRWARSKGIRVDWAEWAKRNGHDVSEDPEPISSAKRGGQVPVDAPIEGLTKRERQIRAIEEAADAKGFPRHAVPIGGKKELREYCKINHSDLFGAGDSPFDDAWKEASPARIAIESRAKFAGE